jgi:hypothetical protein
LAADGAGHFYMTWDAGATRDVYFCRSLDSGATWFSPVRMAAAGEAAAAPALVVDDRGDIYLTWRFWDGANATRAGRLRISRDLGKTWTMRILDGPSGWAYWRPLIAARARGAIDLFQGRCGTNSSPATLYIDHHYSLDYGITWHREEVDAGGAPCGDLYPRFRFGPQNQAYFAWGANSLAGHYYSHWNFFLRRSGAGDWGTIQDLHTFCPASDERTALSVSAQSVDTVLTGPGCLYLLRSTDDGDSWPVPEAVAGSEGFRVAGGQDMAAHPAGKTFLVFIKEAAAESSLYLTSFE